MKKIVLLITLVISSTLLFAAPVKEIEDSVKTYRKAKDYYEEQNYGKALKYAEDAITYKKQQVEKENKILKDALSARRVQAVGNKIDDILKILDNRGEKEAIRIINLYLKKKGSDYFENDINNLLIYINENSEYPEAQKIIGDIYKLEGEYSFAEEYYLMALNNKEILDIPDEKYEILYMLADLSRLKNDDEQMETRLLNIIADDENFRDEALFNAMFNTIKTNKSDSVEKFFTLYRATSYYSLDAYNQLKEYYFEKGEAEKALRFSALSTITGFSKIIDILYSRNISYSYTNLNDFFQEAATYYDVVEWGSKHEVWKSFNDFAKMAKNNGYNNFSETLLKSIAQFTPDTYWQKNAVLQLSSDEYTY